MEKEDVEKYVMSQEEVSTPTIQKQFGLSYVEARRIIGELTACGVLKFKSGLTFTVNKYEAEARVEGAKPREIPEALDGYFIKALWHCIVKKSVDAAELQRYLQLDNATVMRLIDKMEVGGFVTIGPDRVVAITDDEYIERFGLYPWMTYDIGDVSGKSDDDSDDGLVDDDDDDEGEYRGSMLTGFLISAFYSCIVDNGTDGKCIMGMEDKASGFPIKIINDDDGLTISDCGKAAASSGVGRRKVQNLLKSYDGVELSGDELYVTVRRENQALIALMKLYAAADAVRRLK